MNKGFTLIELLMYVVLITIVMGTLVPFSWEVIQGGARSAVEQEVYSTARFISERIKYEIRNSTGITSVAASSLQLAPGTTVSWVGEKLLINGVPLNANDTKITSLVFTNYSTTTPDLRTQQVQFSFTLTSALAQTRAEYRQSVSLEGSAEVRSH